MRYEVDKVVLIDSLSEPQGACSNCHPQLDWRCSDTTCINNTQVCDGKEDCSDGGDEQLCNFICYNMETIAMEVSRVIRFHNPLAPGSDIHVHVSWGTRLE